MTDRRGLAAAHGSVGRLSEDEVRAIEGEIGREVRARGACDERRSRYGATSSTRRLSARPSSLALEPTGAR